ncbi:MAG: hypothetical protein GF383_10660 [Candidatus Lokiarchaeota archaeon]|nr:hypothetical protein [Candidatus Lokiarchaeota archaeon]MBD3341034.1 hypothetical protein [Candidatus Lokiarchaeota archaeon]
MAVTSLTTLELLQGVLTLIFVVVSIILGVSIMLKYFKYQNRSFLLFGISWICLISPYWPDAITILTITFFNSELPEILYFFLAMAFVPVVHITWIMAMTDLIYRNKKMVLMAIFTIEAVLYEIFFLFFLFTNKASIGTRVATFDIDWSLFVIIYLLFSIVAFTITGLMFAIESLRSEKDDIRLKGYFLLIAFLSFAIGTFFESILVLNPLILVIIRIIVLFAAFEFYIGFTLPSIIKKAFLKQ